VDLIVALSDTEAARLEKKARQEGTTPQRIVRQAIEQILSDSPAQPRNSLLGIWEVPESDLSDAAIDNNRREMFASFGARAL
jgi:hypothetical protein